MIGENTISLSGSGRKYYEPEVGGKLLVEPVILTSIAKGLGRPPIKSDR